MEVKLIKYEATKEDYLCDMPKGGPLEKYRKQASFDWKLMRLAIEDERVLQFKYSVWKTLEKDPLFARSATEPTMDEARRITTLKAFKVLKYQFVDENDITDPFLMRALHTSLGQYEWSTCIKEAVLTGFFRSPLTGMGTEKHHEYIRQIGAHEISGCFSLTEISHGTNTRGMRTTATWDNQKKKFILNTPDFESAKCWAANLGKTANYAVVFAQLYTPDRECHGLHAFVIPIRDKNTLQVYPGIIIGDMGEKLGLNGLDNGFMLFDNYEVNKDCLLNKLGNVTEDGKYETTIKETSKRFSTSLGTLSTGRIIIMSNCNVILTHAVTIALRYSAVRKQFGANESQDELPVIEYQMQQWRIFPYLAATYVLKIFTELLFKDYLRFMIHQMSGDLDRQELANMSGEIHALSCAGKPVCSWLTRDGVQEAREACGGHGYIRASGIGTLRNDNDANMTYEGDNNVLLQQTCNWLISIWSNSNRRQIKFPLNSLSNIITNSDEILAEKFNLKNVNDLLEDPNQIIKAYKYLICKVLNETSIKYKEILQSGKSEFEAKNESQIYAARTLSILFFEHYVINRVFEYLQKPILALEIRKVIKNLLSLFGLWSLEKHLGLLYQEEYASGQKMGKIVREGILMLCTLIKPEAISLVDAISPPDFILNSVLGNSDGEVYKHLHQSFLQSPGSMERATFWKDIVSHMKSKI